MALTVGAWLQSLQALLPPGRALTRQPGAVLTRLLEAIAAVFARAEQDLDATRAQYDPLAATTLLPDWERLLGLPDGCQVNLALSMAERQRLASQRLMEQGGQSRAYFIALAAQLGEPGATITEFRQATCNSNCNDALYSQADEFVWRMNIRNFAQGTRPSNCGDNCNVALQIYTPNLIECPITERKPAHTTVLFAYDATSYAPADLQAYHTRASKAWAFNAAGVLQEYAPNVLRVVPSPDGIVGAMFEPASTNKCTNYNANPAQPIGTTATTASPGTINGMTASGDAAGVLSIVDDAAALAVAGLQNVCTSGVVYKLDNSAGTGTFQVGISGATANTNSHTSSAWVRGSGSFWIGHNSALWSGKIAAAAYARASDTHIPSSSVAGTTVRAAAGAVIYFVLNQLEERPFATSPILTTGATVTRASDDTVWTGAVPVSNNEGSLYVYGSGITGQDQQFFGVGDGNISGMSLRRSSADLRCTYRGATTGAASDVLQGPFIAAGAIKLAGSWSATNLSFTANGRAAATGAINLLAAPLTKVRFAGSATAGAPTSPVWLYEVRTYRWRLSDAQLQAVTT